MNEGNVEKAKKIVIKSDTELIDVINAIASHKGEFIILTFAESSDLLVSPVNLKVIQDTSDEQEKTLVIQIIQNPSGVRNAEEAGLVVATSAGTIGSRLWDESQEKMLHRRALKAKSLRAVDEHMATKAESVTDAVMEVSDEDNTLNSVEKLRSDAELESENSQVEIEDNSGNEQPVELSQFQKQVRNAVDKSKSDIQNGNTSKIASAGGLTVALDSDISNEVKSNQGSTIINNSPKPTSFTNVQNGNSLIGKDFSDIINSGELNERQTEKLTPKRVQITKDIKSPLIPAFAYEYFTKFKRALKGKNYKKIALYLGVPSLLTLGLISFYLYRFTPIVHVEIFIESRSVEIEETFTGDPSISSFDLEEREIAVKEEVIKETLSDSANATGTAVRGEKAGGVVSIKCFLDGPQSIPSGTILTTNGLNFVLIADTPMLCPSIIDATVQAAEVGPEYNISSNKFFTVAGFETSQITAENLTSFSGGSKEEYKVVSQGDYDTLLNSLKNSAFEDAKGELEDKAKDGWELIPSTVTNKVVGDPEVDHPVGSESDVINMSIKTESSALYYKKSDLEDVSEELLLQAARDQNLFDTTGDTELKLEDINTSIVVESADKETKVVTVKMNVSGTVKPTVDKEQIKEDLSGLNWDKGIEYLDDLEFVAEPTKVKFLPEWFPEGLRYFPSRQGRINVKVTEIEAEIEVEQ
jgi:hypothetical protein